MKCFQFYLLGEEVRKADGTVESMTKWFKRCKTRLALEGEVVHLLDKNGDE